MVAYHFPPLAGSSGVQRTLRFSSYLPQFGWEPIVLTAHPRAYSSTSTDQLDQIAPGVRVVRAPAWDTKRLFSVRGRYPAFLARPDRWLSWWLGAVPLGLWLIRKLGVHAIWSTFPIATAHLIGATLATRTGLPWIADFRDPMAQPGYPSDPATHASFVRIEQRTTALARCCTFTAPGAVDEYARRYPAQRDRFRLLENGYDEHAFGGLEPAGPLNPGRFTLLHSGIVYAVERDPTQLFAALARLRDEAPQHYARVVVRFRAAVNETLLAELAGRYAVEDAIEILPRIGYRDGLREMLSADALLLLQASNCNAQIPAKFYEYLRARRPIVALTDPAGDTARAARDAGLDAIARLDDPAEIAALLSRVLESPTRGTLPSEAAVAAKSRRRLSGDLAALLDEVVALGADARTKGTTCATS